MACATTSGASAEGACEATVDVLHHDVALDLSLAPASLTGRGVLSLRTRAATRTVGLDAQALHVSRVTFEGAPVTFVTRGDRLCVDLARSLPAGAPVSLSVEWAVPTTGEVPKFSPGQIWAGYLSSAWLPTVQDPAQRATLTLRVTTEVVSQVVWKSEMAHSSGGQQPPAASQAANRRNAPWQSVPVRSRRVGKGRARRPWERRSPSSARAAWASSSTPR